MPKNLNIEKSTFKVAPKKFLAMHITNQKLSFDIFTVGHLQNIFMEHDLYYPNEFWHKRKNNHFDPYNLLLSIAKNIPVLLCGPGSHIMFIYLIKNTGKTVIF